MWTENQQTAIDATCADNLVSAAAGSGKTAVMVERIVNRVVSGQIDIDKLLVVTFTNAAASELKSRLMNKITEALDKSENTDYLNKQLLLINTASISTIDSFCLNVLRNNFYKLGLDPSFKIADSAELELIREDTLNEIFEEYYENNDINFLKLVDCFTTKNDEYLAEIIKKSVRYTDSLPDGIASLRIFCDKFSGDFSWKEGFITSAHKAAETAIECYNTAISYCSFSDDYEKLRLFLTEEKNYFELIRKANEWNRIKCIVDSVSFDRISFPKSIDISDKTEIKRLRDKSKDIFKKISENFSMSYEEIIEDTNQSFLLIDKLVEIAEKFSERVGDAKQKKGIVDFVDIEHYTLKLLRDENGTQSDIAKQLMYKYDEIYIDEYQDCNEVQEEIFSLISRKNIGNPNIFMVGDMKQSIYGFRGSQPQLFKKKADTYCSYTPENKYNKIILNKNFRSRKVILDFVNSVFSQIMSVECGELAYTEDEYLYPNDDMYDDIENSMKNVDVVLFETNPAYGDAQNEEEIKKTEAEAIYTANRIKEYIAGKCQVFDKSQKSYRACKYSDIVILLRSAGEKAEIFNRILSAAQIPVYCEAMGEYYSTPEISFLINFLKITDNPLDDLALLSVMRHPVFSFDENDFVAVRLCKSKGYFYDSIRFYVSKHTDNLSSKLNDFLSILSSFHEKSKYLSADALLWEFIKYTDYMAYLSFSPNSELKKGNVNALLTRANDFEKTSYKGIFDFIRYIDKLKKSNNDIEQARTLSDDEDVVRIMTIHKSKGLEFPIVFLGDCGKKFNESDITKEKLLIHKEFGFGIDYYDTELRYHYELPQKKFIKLAKHNELLSEEMRILYVALTRAREKLIITASVRNIETHIEKLSMMLCDQNKVLSSDVTSSVSSYIDWILLGILRNKDLRGVNDFSYKYIINDNINVNFSIKHKDSEILDLKSTKCIRNIHQLSDNPITTDMVYEILDYSYPYTYLSEIPSNISVTELKKIETKEDSYNYFTETLLVTPSFCSQNTELSPSEKGTLTHLVMEKLDFSSELDYNDISKQIYNMADKGYILKDNIKYININSIERFLKSDLGIQMRNNASHLVKEFGFKYLMNADIINSNAQTDEKVVVQGMIDAYFETENGDVIMIDYKTDKVSDINDIIIRYSPQLKYYKIALEKVLNKKVSKKYLVLLDTGETIEC